MNQAEYISQAVASWILERLKKESDFSCEGLPSLDVSHFFRCLAADPAFPQENFSIALAGFGMPTSELENQARRAGFSRIVAVSDDLHIAAEWRNDRNTHPRSIALASGYPAGVHTLSHYGRPKSSDLAVSLLTWAASRISEDEALPEVHARLLNEIAQSSVLNPLRSLEACAQYLHLWDQLIPDHRNQAPCHALSALGLLADPQLFEADPIGDRLALNLQIVGQIKQLRTSSLSKLETRVGKYKDLERRERVLSATAAVRTFLSDADPSLGLLLAQALDVVKAPGDQEPTPDPDDPQPLPLPTPPQKTPRLEDVAADSLLDGNEQDLSAISDAIEQAWEDFEPNSAEDLKVSIALPSGGEFSDQLPIDRNVLGWVEDFCSEQNWGGLIETSDTKLLDALARASDGKPIPLRCERIVNLDGEWFSMESLLQGWDEDLKDLNPGLLACWSEFRSIRLRLLPHLPKLLFHAREWLDGRSHVLADIRAYLEQAAKLYKGVQENYRQMSEGSSDWARMTLEALLGLDVLQVRVQLPNGDTAAKAVLMPTHPLHLWRNERLSSLLRGLSRSMDLASEDREVICESLKRPEQFLSVIRLGTVPEGRGLSQLLPLADQIEGLPVFENLINACSGLDGVKCLAEAIDQYVVLHPNHPFPLRIAVVNPPRPEALLADFVRILNDPRYRGAQRLAAIDLDIYATAKHRDRLDAALSFSDSRYEDIVQEKIASGRLVLNLHEAPPDESTLERIVEHIQQRPVHLAAIFDESTIHIRRRSAGHLLPMSPFCIRQDLKLDRRTGTIEIKPQPGESPFSEFLLLMSELEGTQRDTTPYAHADAESLAQTTDTLLQGEASPARWMFLADRALPQESGMRSVKIWERREGQRDTFLAARDFSTLARLLRPVFASCNLTVSRETMTGLLHQGARLLGSGLLGMIKKQDGKPDQKLVVGFAGLILAARDFQRRYPGCLVLSVDHPIARLWLRTGTRMNEDRCDLLVLRHDGEQVALTAVEVKSSLGEELSDGAKRLGHAKEQALATLQAVEDGLSAGRGGSQSPLSIPRCEMLKFALARAAQARTADPATDRDNRKRWGLWLLELFPEAATSASPVNLEAVVVSVLLQKASPVRDVTETTPDGKRMVLRTLSEPDINSLIAAAKETDPSAPPFSLDESKDLPSEDFSAKSPDPERPEEPGSASVDQDSGAPRKPPGGNTVAPMPLIQPTPADNLSVANPHDWPPPVNRLGMIGQHEPVMRLVEQALYARNTGRRFSDKLLVGPAGVGKSTLVRKIAELVLGRDHLFLSGSSLRQPRDLIECLRRENLVPSGQVGVRIVLESCLVFVDEVHGISNPVATMLLSAMDDARTSTIENTLYDFQNVIFLLATTDPGKLSEAFQSRPNKTYLSPYTLHELAGIIWLHGKSALDGAELSKEACYEIAARCRCNPRRSVRDLTEALIPHFYSRAHQAHGEDTTHQQISEIMTSEAIAAFYEAEGIDFNGLDNVATRFLTYLKQHGSASEATLRQALGIPHANDFLEVAEYLVRLGLIETTSGGRRLTREGLRYLKDGERQDLRDRISRAFE